MNKTINMSNTVFSIQVNALLDTLGPWRIRTTEESDPEFSFEFGPSERNPANANGAFLRTVRWGVFEVRQRVFDVTTPEDATKLFRDFGPWHSDERYVGRNIRFSEVMERRAFYENALLNGYFGDPSSENWEDNEDFLEDLNNLYLSEPLTMSLNFGEPPYGVVRCADIEEALRASVFLEKQDGLGWRKCQCKGCGRVFKLTSNRERIYCSTDCAHLQSVRSYNKRKAAGVKSGNEKVRS